MRWQGLRIKKFSETEFSRTRLGKLVVFLLLAFLVCVFASLLMTAMAHLLLANFSTFGVFLAFLIVSVFVLAVALWYFNMGIFEK